MILPFAVCSSSPLLDMASISTLFTGGALGTILPVMRTIHNLPQTILLRKQKKEDARKENEEARKKYIAELAQEVDNEITAEKLKRITQKIEK